MALLDTLLFFVSVIGVIALGIWKAGRHSSSGETSDYFLAGRGLTWWLVGFSLIAANISTEQFVGMSGASADWLGMAIASYEWMAAITLVIVGFLFLPKFLKAGIFTIPEFLEHRYGPLSRLVMALLMMVILVGVPTASVVFSGAKVVSVLFQDYSPLGIPLGSLTFDCWMIGLCAALYVFIGGLRSCAWTDLIWGSALILGGAVIAFLAFSELGSRDPADLIATKVATSEATVTDLANAGALERFVMLNSGEAVEGDNGSGGKLHMIRPASDPDIPWTALLVGLWIPNFFYWGLNQYIMQRTLGSRSLAEGQKGIILAAGLKLLIPFVVVIPGILAFNLFSADLQEEANRKNTDTLAAFEAKESVVIPFKEDFARLNPGLSFEIFSHNQSLAGLTPLESGSPSTSTELVNANQAALDKATSAGIAKATALVAYDYDAAFPTLLRNLLKPGISWFVLAAITGAVISSLASMLNSASTIFTMDLYAKLNKSASQKQLVGAGRVSIVVFALIACMIAPNLGNPAFGKIFTFIQEFQGFISPGVLVVFLFGVLCSKTPRMVGWFGILLNAVLYGIFKLTIPEVSFLNRMAFCFGLVAAAVAIITLIKPLKEPVTLPENTAIPLESSPGAKFAGIAVCVLTVALYLIFW